MPIYEYECLSCGNQFEKIVFNLNAVVSCPKCDKQEVRKKPSLFSSPGSGKKSAGASACASCTSKNCGSCG